MKKSIEASVEELLRPFLDEKNFQLVDIEYVKEGRNFFLRVYVDKPGGIDIDDCGEVSEYLSAKLDENDPIPDAYFLEVSSPGAERPLKKTQDYIDAVGKNVFVTTYEPIQGKKEFEGTLLAYDEEQLTIETAGRKKTVIPVPAVASARLAVVF